MDNNTSQSKKHEVHIHKKLHVSQQSQRPGSIATMWKTLTALFLLLLLFLCTTIFSHATKSIATPVDVIVTPIPTVTVITTPSPGPSPTIVVTPSPTIVVTPSPTVVVTPSPTIVVTPSPTVVVTPSPTVVVTPSPTVVVTPSPTVVVTPSPTPTQNPTATPIPTVGTTPTAGVAPTIVPTQKAGAAPQPVATPQPTKTPQPTATPSPVPTLRSVATATVNTKRIITANQETHSESVPVIPLVLGTLLIVCLGGVGFIGFRRVRTALLPAISAQRPATTPQNARPWQRIRTLPQPAAQPLYGQATSHIAPLPVSPSHTEPLMGESRTGAMRRLGRIHLQTVAPQEASDE